MHRHHVRASLRRTPDDILHVDATLRIPETHFDRQRQIGSFTAACDRRFNPLWIQQDRAAPTLADDFFNRTAHVDVDCIKRHFVEPLDGVRYRSDIGARDLHPQNILVRMTLHHGIGARAGMIDGFRRQHLNVGKTGTGGATHAAKRNIADTSKRRQENAIADL